MCGIPENVLYTQDESTIDSMYEESLTHHIELVSFDESEGFSQNYNSGIATAAVSDGDFELTTTVLAVYDNNRVTFLYYAVYTKYEWTEPSGYRKTDGIVVNWDADLLTYVSGTFYYDPSYRMSTTASWQSDTARYTNVPDNIAQGGVGVTFNLRSGESSYLRGTAFVRLAKKNASASGNYTTISSNYAHTVIDTAAESLTIGLTDVNVTFSCTASYQNAASSASVTIP